MKYSGIIFDFNGVLLWDSALHERAWRECSEELRGDPFTNSEILEHVHGRISKYTFEYLLKRPVHQDELQQLIQKKESNYRKLCLELQEQFKLSPGTIELLTFLMEHDIPHTIATAAEQSNLQFYLKHLDLAKWFDIEKIVFDDGTLPGKPEPDIYLKAAENIGLSPAECIVVEDSLSGICAAKQAEIGKIYALGPKEKHEELQSIDGVHEVICHVGEIPHYTFGIQ